MVQQSRRLATSTINLTTYDPIAAINSGDANGAAVEEAGDKVYDTVAMVASAVAGAGGTFSTAIKDAFAGIAAAVEGAGINLSNKAGVSALVTDVAQTEHLTLASGVADNVAALIVADNAALDQKLAADGSTKIAIRVTVMNEVQFLPAAEPRKPLKPRPLYVIFLVEKDMHVKRRRACDYHHHKKI